MSKVAHVEGALWLEDESLSGQTSSIENLALADENGGPILFEPQGEGAFIVKAPAGGVQVQLVLAKPYVKAANLIEELITKQLLSAAAIFGKPPSFTTKYLIVIDSGDSNQREIFTNSIRQQLAEQATTGNRALWGRHIARELMHLWNGLSMVPSGDEEAWFTEGVTGYLALTALAQNRLMDAATLKRELANTPAETNTALALDFEIRRSTKNAQSLTIVMRALFAKFSGTGRSYTAGDLTKAVETLTGVVPRSLITCAPGST